MPGNFGQVMLVELRGDRVETSRATLPEAVYRTFLGGVGLGAYLLWTLAPPEPTRMRCVPPAMCPTSTAVAELAMPGMLWCSASQ